MLRTQDKRLFLGRTLSAVVPTYIPPQFETIGDPGGGSQGTTVTANVSANTEGAYAELSAATTIDADGFEVRIPFATDTRDYLLDIALGSGPEVNIIDDLMFTSGSGGEGPGHVYIPLPIPAGSRVSARVRATSGSAAILLSLVLVKGGFATAQRMRRATTYGANTADSGGAGFDPGASANTKGAWSEVVAATTNPCKAVLICVGSRANAVFGSPTHHLVDLGTGAESSEQVLIGDLHVNARQDSDVLNPVFAGPFPASLQAGVRLAARSQCQNTDATDRLADLVVIGFD